MNHWDLKDAGHLHTGTSGVEENAGPGQVGEVAPYPQGSEKVSVWQSSGSIGRWRPLANHRYPEEFQEAKSTVFKRPAHP